MDTHLSAEEPQRPRIELVRRKRSESNRRPHHELQRLNPYCELFINDVSSSRNNKTDKQQKGSRKCEQVFKRRQTKLPDKNDKELLEKDHVKPSNSRLKKVKQSSVHLRDKLGVQGEKSEQNAQRNNKNCSKLAKELTEPPSSGCQRRTFPKFVQHEGNKLASGRSLSKLSESSTTTEQATKKRRYKLILQGDSDDEDEKINIKTEQSWHAGPIPTGNGYNDEVTLRMDEIEIENSLKVVQNSSNEDLGSVSNSEACNVKKIESFANKTLGKRTRVFKRRIPANGDNDLGVGQSTSKVSKASRSELDAPSSTEDTVNVRAGETMENEHDAAGGGCFLTSRQITMLSGKGGDYANLIEFPDGLLPKKRKPRLTEEEKLARKEEAVRKRREYVEKAAKEIQASAIHKILSQDSSRKKRDDKLQKQRREIVEGKKASELMNASNSVRWSFGPCGTTVSWSSDVQLPEIFTAVPPRYPPPREKCAVSTCNNAYKYRDTKLNLPLCSLQCYKMIQPLVSVSPAC